MVIWNLAYADQSLTRDTTHLCNYFCEIIESSIARSYSTLQCILFGEYNMRETGFKTTCHSFISFYCLLFFSDIIIIGCWWFKVTYGNTLNFPKSCEKASEVTIYLFKSPLFRIVHISNKQGSQLISTQRIIMFLNIEWVQYATHSDGDINDTITFDQPHFKF